MKVFPILVCLFLTAAVFAQETSLDSKFRKKPNLRTEQVNCGNCMLILDDDITMDKLYTSIRYELIYSGSENNKIFFKHNEYLSDENGFFTKAGYSSDMEYDIKKSNVIAYKGLKLEIVSANSQGLKYRILTEDDDSDFETARLVTP